MSIPPKIRKFYRPHVAFARIQTRRTEICLQADEQALLRLHCVSRLYK